MVVVFSEWSSRARGSGGVRSALGAFRSRSPGPAERHRQRLLHQGCDADRQECPVQWSQPPAPGQLQGRQVWLHSKRREMLFAAGLPRPLLFICFADLLCFGCFLSSSFLSRLHLWPLVLFIPLLLFSSPPLLSLCFFFFYELPWPFSFSRVALLFSPRFARLHASPLRSSSVVSRLSPLN